MRVIDTDYNDAFFNMAVDEILLENDEPVLRFYRWKPAALSLGYNQKFSDIDADSCKKQGIDIVRRITGGKAVLHDDELTYSFIINESKMPKGIVESYKIISCAIVKALDKLGIKAEMKEEVEKAGSAVCFNDPSYYEITVDGKKAVGSAQKRMNGKLLQHGSLLLGFDADKLGSLFKDDVVKERITALNLDYEELKLALTDSFADNFNEGVTFNELSEDELDKAKELANKYSSEEWNSRL